jgi:4-amino-4-deoxy-L-arabinose transferase-like glycosyltransferase
MGRALAWLALAVIGELARLRLIHAGPLVGYQHYLAPRAMVGTAPLAVAIVVLQGLAAAWGVGRLWPRLHDWLGAYGPWRLAGVAALVVITSAALSREPLAFGTELAVATLLQAIALATIVLAAAAVPASVLDAAASALRRLLPEDGPDAPPAAPIDRFALTAAAWVVLACAVLAVLSYQRHPHVPDEVSYIYQARYFAHGMLSMPAPPVRDAFDLDLMTFEPTRWYSPVPPGWPAVLSLGVLLGVPWLVNPLLNGCNVLLVYVLVGGLYGRRTARWSVLLLATSPWFLFMGMNFMTHTLALLAALMAAVSVARMRRSGSMWWGVLGGVAIGLVSIIRPLEGLAVAMVLGLWTLLQRGRPRLTAAAQLSVLAAASMVAGALVLPYNRAMSGHATTFPLMAYTDAMYGAGVNALGFGANRGMSWPGLDPLPGHGALDVVINAALNAYQVNVELLGWSTGSILVVGLLAFSGRMRRTDWWLLAVIGVVVGLHSFYWFSGGPDFGARSWYLVIVPCIALAARGIEELERSAAAEPSGRSSRATLGALALCAVATTVFVPWRAVDKYHHYRGMQPGVERLAQAYDFGSSLVLVRGNRHPDYASAATYNPLDLRAPQPIYAWDRDSLTRAAVVRAYPDRPVWIVAGPTVTSRGFQVIAGPLTAQQALSWRSVSAATPAPPRANTRRDGP